MTKIAKQVQAARISRQQAKCSRNLDGDTSI